MNAEGRKQKGEGRNQKAESINQKSGGSKRTRTKGQGLGFALMAALTCLMGLRFAENGIADEPEQSPTFTVRVYNYVHASPATLAWAEREADRIFSEAGVQAAWLDCLAVEPTTGRQNLCQESSGAAEVVLRILAKPGANS